MNSIIMEPLLKKKRRGKNLDTKTEIKGRKYENLQEHASTSQGMPTTKETKETSRSSKPGRILH